jgi:dTDP-4-dehydrorhamnose reductase
MVVYVTGIAGLLGSSIVKELRDKYIVTGADRNNIDVYSADYDVMDLLDYNRLGNSIEKRHPDIIVHTAAMINVDGCENDPESAKRMNSDLTHFLADIAKKRKIKLIYISTDAVFDGTKEGLYREEDDPNPINVYGHTKLDGERYVLENDDGLVLRTNIYGINLQNKQSFGEWIADSLYSGMTLNMFKDIRFSPVLVNELANVIGKCIENNVGGLFHVCGTGSISKYEFGVALKEEFGIDTGRIIESDSSIMNFKARRSKNMGMSNRKICDRLDITIRTPVESIREFHRLYDEKSMQERRKL